MAVYPSDPREQMNFLMRDINFNAKERPVGFMDDMRTREDRGQYNAADNARECYTLAIDHARLKGIACGAYAPRKDNPQEMALCPDDALWRFFWNPEW